MSSLWISVVEGSSDTGEKTRLPEVTEEVWSLQ
jgi:hypothetical protein